MSRRIKLAGQCRRLSLGFFRGPSRNAISVLILAIVVVAAVAANAQQSTKSATKGGKPAPKVGRPAASGQVQQSTGPSNYGQQQQPQQFDSPATQGRQQQQQQLQQEQQVQNTRQQPNAVSQRQPEVAGGFRQKQQLEDDTRPEGQQATEDPLADSEPALYGSVAGSPGVDFPAYTRIPKTSFTCEGKGFDFGFYADQEAQCQVYHVCWDGRHESFLCGVGTVFNQAILACDYWHSVDCSKSSQFYGVNSELGKAGAEPSGGSQRVAPARPSSSSSSALGGETQFGEPANQQRKLAENLAQTPEGFRQQQQQQQSQRPSGAKQPQRTSFDYGQQQQQQQQPIQQQQLHQQQAQPQPQPQPQQPPAAHQQRLVQVPSAAPEALKAPARQSPAGSPTVGSAKTVAGEGSKRARYSSADFNHKVNSLIEAPVRAPIKSHQEPLSTPRPVARKTAARQYAAPASTSFRPRPAPKGTWPAQVQEVSLEEQPQQQQQQQQSYEDTGLLSPVEQQQQQQIFDDTPVQTSTSSGTYLRPAATPSSNKPITQQQQQQQQPLASSGNSQQQAPIQQFRQLILHPMSASDGSSAVTGQYDTFNLPDSQSSSDESAAQLEDQAANDDFRAAGARAAASHNQNWYIMHTI